MGFETIDPEHFERKLEEARFADIVIALRRIAEAVPVASGVGGGFDILRAIDGIETDGRVLGSIERSYTAAFGALGIIAPPVGWVSRAHNRSRLGRELSQFSKLLDVLPRKLDEYRRSGGTLDPTLESFLARFLLKEHVFKTAVLESRVSRGVLHISRIDLSDPKKAEAEFFRTLSHPAVRTVAFDQTLPLETKRFLSNVLAHNHPLLEIERLAPGDTIANASFKGVKPLNDRLGQEFVDQLTVPAQRRMTANFDRNFSAKGKRGRVIRRNYKHSTFSAPGNASPEKVIFGEAANRRAFVEDIVEANGRTVRELSERLSHDPKTAMSEAEIAAFIREKLDVSVGVSTVPPGAGTPERLMALREAELAAKRGNSGKGFEAARFTPDDMLRISDEAVLLKKQIIEKWGEARFELGGIRYPVIIRLENEARISPELFDEIRK